MSTQPNSVLGWWFGGDTLPHGDDRAVAVGTTHTVDGEIVPCKNGLHSSERPIDALRYARSGIVWRTRSSGTIVRGDDQIAASERAYLARLDATAILRDFARKCALDVIHLWDAPDVVRRFLETGDESLRDAARDAALAALAAGAAAYAAYVAGAAGHAARDARYAADAARDARYAADAADAARDKQNEWLTAAIEAAIRQTGGPR